MDTAEHMRTLDEEGRLLAAAAREAGTDAEVPTCPGWRVRDLLRHTGTVHRWATGFVADGHPVPRAPGAEPELDGEPLVAWYEEGHRRLVDTLRTAPADVACWSFLPAPSPLAFWARRQAHETTVHRADAQSALGGTPAGPTAALAVDGIDELLLAFHARPKSRVRTDKPRVLRVRATDTGVVWTMRLSPEPPVTTRTDTATGPHGGAEREADAAGGMSADANLDGDADPDVDCEIAGPASQLYLSLWNRVPFPSVAGDPSLAALWRDNSGIVMG
ncbi:maleylpyruvate isomerase family mycothiol-dependent enzyme [Streptomyces neyagawaensis]|uniref:Maleylpyruvate isomerase family mycothiol-dependent enzyme n=1 Tax=Streptomyces neyagawaensis TaxID=42238 RepID=A0ABV3B9Q8_9ACTN